jgi:enediyne biosynthesis protein E3
MSALLYSLLKIDPREADFSRRGFNCSRPEVQDHLERIGKTFLLGYHAALGEPDQRKLAAALDEIQLEYRGFGYEGASMALVLLDAITPWKHRFADFLAGAGRNHVYMLHVGAGWGYARLPWVRRRIESQTRRFDPVLSSLVIDGYGFHEGYFHWQQALQPKISLLSPHGRHIFYQGLGRSLWFREGTDAAGIDRAIASFALAYQADAWSGVGLACAYAGGIDRSEIEELYIYAAPFRAALAQGAAFAAKTRLRAGNPVLHTEVACNVFCRMSSEKAAALCDETLGQVDLHHSCPYQYWRELLQLRLQAASEGREEDADSNLQLTHTESRGESHVQFNRSRAFHHNGSSKLLR